MIAAPGESNPRYKQRLARCHGDATLVRTSEAYERLFSGLPWFLIAVVFNYPGSL
jgi:hypothetical protein